MKDFFEAMMREGLMKRKMKSTSNSFHSSKCVGSPEATCRKK